jgi:hypothetical protein
MRNILKKAASAIDFSLDGDHGVEVAILYLTTFFLLIAWPFFVQMAMATTAYATATLCLFAASITLVFRAHQARLKF